MLQPNSLLAISSIENNFRPRFSSNTQNNKCSYSQCLRLIDIRVTEKVVMLLELFCFVLFFTLPA